MISAVMPWVAIQRNPTSGTGGARRELLELVKHLWRHKLRPRIFTRRDRLAAALADPVRRTALKCIVAAGGDGTFRDIINRYPGIRVALFPLGTENLVSRYLKIPRNGRRVADMIAAGKVRLLDLGRSGDRRFTVMASAGFDADVIHRAHARRSGHISRWSYIQPIYQSLRTYSYPEIRVFVDGVRIPETGSLAVLVNLSAYALGIVMASTAKEDDGQFDLRLFQRRGAFQMWRYFLNLLLGRHERLPDVRSMTAVKVRWESNVSIPVQVDGDPAGTTPVEFEILRGAVEVVVP